MPVRVQWFQAVEDEITTFVPEAAHAKAVAEAAGAAAAAIHSTYTGTLARHVSVPAPITPLIAEVGSGPGGRAPLPYGAIEHFGGEIRGRPLLYIRDRRAGATGPTRSTFGAPIVAVVPRVFHKGKEYLNRALEVYPVRMLLMLKDTMPK